MTNSTISKTYPRTGYGHNLPDRRMKAISDKIMDLIFTMHLDKEDEALVINKLHEAVTLANELGDFKRIRYDENI